MKTLQLRLLGFLPLLALVAVVNVGVDPASLWKGTERRIAEIILRGENVANYRNMDDRLLQKLIIGGMKQCPDVVVFGSSRSMQIRSDFFPGRTFFGNTVGSAELPDYMSLYECYHARGFHPSLLVIGLDPWVLNPSMAGSRWKSLFKEFSRISVRLGIPLTARPERGRTLRNSVQMLSPVYFQESLRTWLRTDGGVHATPNPEESTSVLRKDGSFKYPDAYIHRSVEQVRIDAQQFWNSRASASLKEFHRLHTPAQSDLKTFLTSIQKDGTELLIFLSPYHPEVAREFRLNGSCPQVAEAETWIRTLCRDLGIRVIGSYDPEVIGCREEDFLDAIHVKGPPTRPLFLGNGK